MVLARLPRASGPTCQPGLLSRYGTHISPSEFRGATPLQKARLLRSLARGFNGKFSNRSNQNCRREMPRRGSFGPQPWRPFQPVDGYGGSGPFPWQRARCALLPAQGSMSRIWAKPFDVVCTTLSFSHVQVVRRSHHQQISRAGT